MKYIPFQQFIQSVCETMPMLSDAPLDHSLRMSRPAGMLVELGVYLGGSITKIAIANPNETVYGFDSFQGLPESWNRPDMAFGKGTFSLDNRLPEVPSNVELIAGWFNETLPVFANAHKDERISLLHVDCDLYSSTKCAFDVLGPLLQKGSIIVFDELLNYPTFEKHEIKAFYEFLCNSDFEVEWIGKLGPVDLHPVKDNGYYDQPVVCCLV